MEREACRVPGRRSARRAYTQVQVSYVLYVYSITEPNRAHRRLLGFRLLCLFLVSLRAPVNANVRASAFALAHSAVSPVSTSRIKAPQTINKRGKGTNVCDAWWTKKAWREREASIARKSGHIFDGVVFPYGGAKNEREKERVPMMGRHAR